MRASVLIVDDERLFCVMAEEALLSEGFDVRSCGSLAMARVELDRADADLLLLDRKLPDGDGLELLRELRAAGTSTPLVVMVTAYGDIANAVEALRAGAVDYLAKPIQATDLVLKLRKALEVRGLRDRLALAKGSSRAGTSEPRSAAMRAVLAILGRLGASPSTPVLLTGPSGAGKQYTAEKLHELTYPPPSDAPFIDVNCAALPGNLVESELFGHERGAFTDAKTARRGLIEMADGGTLFLDEITELPDASQAKLLKFLDTMRFRRLGGQRELEVSLRVIAATNQDIHRQVRAGRFREDLYHRLAVFHVQVPPLAARREEIPDLAAAFTAHYATRIKKPIKGLSPPSVKKLCAYAFPGNVRELRNIIERAVILAQGSLLSEQDIMLPDQPAALREPEAFFSAGLGPDGRPPSIDALERAYLLRVLEHTGGRRGAAAELLGISYPTFLKRLRELSIQAGVAPGERD